MKKGFLLIALLLANIAVHAQTKVWSLDECIAYAKEQNLRVKSAKLNVESAEVGLLQSQAALLPTLNTGGSSGFRWGRSIDPTTNLFVDTRVGTVNLQGGSNLTVFAGRQLVNSIRQNETNVQASQFSMANTEFEVSVTVASQYLNVLFNQAQLENAKYQLEITTDQLERTRKLVSAGALAMINQLDLEAQQASDELAVVTAENGLSIALLGLKQSMQLPASELLEILVPAIDIGRVQLNLSSPDQIYNVAERDQPGIKAADLNLKAAEYGVRVARGAYMPTFTMGFSFFTNYSDIRDQIFRPDGTVVTVPTPIGYVGGTNQTVFVDRQVAGGEVRTYTMGNQLQDNISKSLSGNLQIPIFNGLRTRTGVQRAVIQEKQAEIQTQDARNQLRQTIESAYNDALAASKTYQASLRRVQSLEESFRATEQRFNLGLSNSVEYQVATNNLFRAKNDLLRAQYDLLFRSTVLDFYMGKPLSL
jgi:outer membrane protein